MRRGPAPPRRGRCCCRCAEDTGRFVLLAALIAAYLTAGASVFSALERPSEAAAQRRWNRTLTDFSRLFNISLPELRAFLRSYEAAMAAGIRAEALRPRWDFPGAFYFVATVVSTIGESRAAAPLRPAGPTPCLPGAAQSGTAGWQERSCPVQGACRCSLQ